MQSVEAAGKTRKEAIQKALDQLGVELHEVEIEILDEGSKGFFGLGSRDVRVRVTAEGLPDRPKAPKPPKPRPQAAPRGEASEGSRPSAPKRNVAKPVVSETTASTKPAPQPKAPLAPIPEGTSKEAAALLGEVIQRMGMEAEVTVAAGEEGTIRLNVASSDSALLIGRKGRNLSALQYLINRMFLTGDHSEADRIIIDIEGYQDRRRQNLEEMALGLARRAKETGREMRVKPLYPQERRMIHLALQDDPDIRTFSLGDSLMRTVVIAPKAASGKGPSGDRPRRPRPSNGNRRRRNGPRPSGSPSSGRQRQHETSHEGGDDGVQDA